MAENSAISWTDHTFNPWIGCTKVSEACEKCYAEIWNNHYRLAPGWGPGIPRQRTSEAYWRGPLTWDRKARKTVYRPRIFCASVADVFDNEVPQEWRDDLWALIRTTPNLHWMLLTKRIGNAPKMLPPDWPYAHVGLMATLENQEVWDRDYPKLMRVPAAWHGVSCEPLLGPIDIGDSCPNWLITGGESGPGFRPLEWMLSARCAISVRATASPSTTSRMEASARRRPAACSTGSSTRAFRRHWLHETTSLRTQTATY
jgi:protein gp37